MRINKLLIILVTALQIFITFAQEAKPPPLECGSIIEDELGEDYHAGRYTINTDAGTLITIVIEPIGDSFNPYLVLLNSSGSEIIQYNSTIGGENEEFSDYTLSSSQPILEIYGGNPKDSHTGYSSFNNATYYGAYIVSLDCTFRDGTRIPAGSTVALEDRPLPPVAPQEGFPGLPSVNFDNGISIPLIMNIPNTGSINVDFDSVFGFTFTGNEADKVTLNYTKIEGNINIGLAVLSEENQIVYMAALISSSTMSTNFTLPSTGEYTIGFFRLDLIPILQPETTSFTVQVDINT